MTNEELICDANTLYRAYLASIKSSKWKPAVHRFNVNYLRHLFRIQDELLTRTLKNGSVIEFQQNERGRLRSITSIPISDRIIRHALCDDVLMPAVQRHIIYDNCASIKGRGISMQRKRFEVHLRRYYKEYGNEGYILFGDFSKFYDNIIHDTAIKQLTDLFPGDDFVDWLLNIIFDGFKIDVSYMTEDEYADCMSAVFNKNEYRKVPKDQLTREKWMRKSVNIGDQLSQVIGIYYANPIDTYVKYVRSVKYYGRYMDDWYIMSPSKDELHDLYSNIKIIADSLGIHINEKKTHITKLSGTYKYLQIKYTLTKSGEIIKRINPKRVTNMRKRLKKLARLYKDGKADYESIENMFRGWMGSYYKLMSREQRSNILSLYEDLFDKTISVEDKSLIFSEKGGYPNGGSAKQK